ncbi:MAG: nucleotide exchange factor GrpE [Planctomycetaceae bacterium]
MTDQRNPQQAAAEGASPQPSIHQPESETTGDMPETCDDSQGETSDVESTSEDPLQLALQGKQEYEEKYLRAMAEMDNMRRRMQRERDEERKLAALPVLRELLPAIDNLSRAVAAAAQGSSVDDLRQGVEMVLAQTVEAFGRLHVSPIDGLGQPFDPNVHEALTQIPSAEVPPMTVVQVVEQGYRLHDRVIRPSKVIVSVEPPTA